jgi:hypothetical protein
VDTPSQLDAVRQIDLGQLSPEEMQRVFRRLLELCDQLLAEQQSLRAALAAKGQRGKGKRKGQGAGTKPPQPPTDLPAASPTGNHSSEAERRVAEGSLAWEKTGKKAALVIDVEEVLFAARTALPPDAVFERFEETVVQDLVLTRRNTRFLRARFRSATTGQSYLTPLPPGFQGQFGPGIRCLALGLNYGANVSMPLLHRFFRQAGCQVSRGQVSRFLTERLEEFVAEATAAIRTAVAHHPWLQIDDTRSGVRTEHGCCHVLGNDLASYYVTTDRGDRRSMIEALFLGAPVTCRLDTRAFACLERWNVALWLRERLQVAAADAPATAAAFETWLDRRFPLLSAEQRERVLTAVALAGYHSQTEVPIARGLLSDDAAVFHGLTDEPALCWVHDFRHYLQLVPERPLHERQLALFKRRYWKLYRRLLKYTQAPAAAERGRLEAAFDRLVDEAKAPPFLAACLARTRKNKAKLLRVLEHPELPLHNNAAELAVRRRVRKRDVSFGPVSAAGRKAWDTLQGLAATVEKLGVSFWDYLKARICQTGEIPPLSELIVQKARRDSRPSSWAAA